MTDADIPNPSRPTLPDTPDISLSAALAYALYRDPDEIGPIDERVFYRAFYRALNAAARRGEITFRGRKNKGVAFDLSFGKKNVTLKEIDATYFGSDDEDAIRGFDVDYNRINAFCFYDDAEIIQNIIDTDQSDYVSYSNVRVNRSGFVNFIETLCKGVDEEIIPQTPIEAVSYADSEVIFPDILSGRTEKAVFEVIEAWRGGVHKIPLNSVASRNEEIRRRINDKYPGQFGPIDKKNNWKYH